MLSFKKISFAAAVFFLAVCAYPNDERPNIVFILADDMGIGDLSCYGQKKFKTPNIDSLASQGIKFNRHYAGSTVCAPSRSCLLTGLHTGHAPIRGNIQSKLDTEGQQEMPADTITLANMLRSCGYKTGAFGKWGLGAQNSHSSPMAMGFDLFFGYNCQYLAHNYYPDHLWQNSKKIVLKGNLDGNRTQYSADIIHSQLINFIKTCSSQPKPGKKPFFIYYAMTLPHAEMAVPQDALEEFGNKFEPETEFKGIPKALYGAQKKPHAAFAAMMKRIDGYVGDIVKALDECGELDNTLIFVTSDNGAHCEGGHDPKYWNSNAGLRGLKRDLYEGGIRVPMIVYWKNRLKNSETDHISAFWDIMPTIKEISGSKFEPTTDGISFAPLLAGKPQPKHDFLYWEFHEQGGKQAVLRGAWKLLKINVNNPKKTKFELYDLSKDETESIDVSGKHPKKLAELKNILEKSRNKSPIKQFNFKD